MKLEKEGKSSPSKKTQKKPIEKTPPPPEEPTYPLFAGIELPGEICAICREKFVGPCSECQSKKDDDETKRKNCVLVRGECNHVYHKHCHMRPFRSRYGDGEHCVLCNTDWYPKHEGREDTLN